MRRLFLILMIAVLPLRAWAGDTMAVGMMTANVAAHVPCAGHDAVESASSQPASDVNSNAHCETCVVCQICHSVALTGLARVQLPPITSPSQPAIRGARFASALLAISLKPPIS